MSVSFTAFTRAMKAWSASAAVVRVILLAPDALTSEEPEDP